MPLKKTTYKKSSSSRASKPRGKKAVLKKPTSKASLKKTTGKSGGKTKTSGKTVPKTKIKKHVFIPDVERGDGKKRNKGYAKEDAKKGAGKTYTKKEYKKNVPKYERWNDKHSGNKTKVKRAVVKPIYKKKK